MAPLAEWVASAVHLYSLVSLKEEPCLSAPGTCVQLRLAVAVAADGNVESTKVRGGHPVLVNAAEMSSGNGNSSRPPRREPSRRSHVQAEKPVMISEIGVFTEEQQ